MWDVDDIENFDNHAITWMTFENIILSKISQSQKVKQILYYYINFKCVCMHVHAMTPVWRSEDNFWQ